MKSKKTVVKLTENDLHRIIRRCLNEVFLITEDRASKSRKQTENVIQSLFKNTLGDRLYDVAQDNNGNPILTQNGDQQTMLQYLERNVRTMYFHNDYANIKFEPGIARIAYGELGLQGNENHPSLQKLGSILKVISAEQGNNYDSNLNGMNFNQLNELYGSQVSNLKKKENDEINNASYDNNSGYTIVKINSFEEAQKFYEYTNPNSPWCIAYLEHMFDTYTQNGDNTLYFAYKKGFEKLKPIKGENCPLDEYGLSLLSIIMNPDYGEGGSLAYCTCRWNHANGGSDSVMNAQELSKVLGGSVFKLCPSKKEELIINGDLGLPSGTIWSTKNVGASSITDFGKYFAFNTAKGYYEKEVGDNMFTEEWYESQEKVDWTNYRFEDGTHAPSIEQCKELVANCEYKLTTYKGVKGGLFTSNINGNSIFIPATGAYNNGSLLKVGEYGGLWSGSLYDGSTGKAWYLGFYSEEAICGYGNRYCGLTVRGVK